MSNREDYHTIKESTFESLENYVRHGLPPGGFVTAVLENNLMEAFGRADLENRESLFEITSYVYNELPASCHGSPERVARWLESFIDKTTERK